MSLLDSNILIYSGEPQFSALLLPYTTNPANLFSVVSMVETLGYHKITSAQILYFQSLFKILKSVPIDDIVIQKAVELRQMKNISLGDALIAATALVLDEELVSRNTADFAGIPGLKVVNPLP